MLAAAATTMVLCNIATLCYSAFIGGKKEVAPLARRAIKGLANMLTKGCCLQHQSEADALKVSPVA